MTKQEKSINIEKVITEVRHLYAIKYKKIKAINKKIASLRNDIIQTEIDQDKHIEETKNNMCKELDIGTEAVDMIIATIKN